MRWRLAVQSVNATSRRGRAGRADRRHGYRVSALLRRSRHAQGAVEDTLGARESLRFAPANRRAGDTALSARRSGLGGAGGAGRPAASTRGNEAIATRDDPDDEDERRRRGCSGEAPGINELSGR